MSTQWVNFRALRQTLRFTDVLKHYGIQFKMKGDRATAFCPLPGHPQRVDGKPRTASLSIHLGRNIFQCFGCKAAGNVLDFACRMEGFEPTDSAQFRQGVLKVATTFRLPLGQAKKDEASSVGSIKGTPPPIKHATPERPTSLPHRIVNAPLDFDLKDLDPSHRYLQDRGLLPETIKAFGLGHCNRGLMKSRIAIPLHNLDGQLVGYAGRITNDSMVSDECPKYRFPGDREREGVKHEFRKSHLLYNYHRIKAPVDNVIVVEGFASTWWLWQAQLINTIALMGSDCSEIQAELITRLVRPGGRIWLMPDGDEAGVDCAYRLFDRLAPHRFVRWIQMAVDMQPTDYSVDELELLFRD